MVSLSLLQGFNSLRTLRLKSFSGWTEAALAELVRSCLLLEELSLCCSGVVKACCRTLSALPRLEQLEVAHPTCRLADKQARGGVARIEQANLSPLRRCSAGSGCSGS